MHMGLANLSQDDGRSGGTPEVFAIWSFVRHTATVMDKLDAREFIVLLLDII